MNFSLKFKKLPKSIRLRMTPPPLKERFNVLSNNMITARNTTKVRLFYEILIRFAKNLDFWP